MELPPGRRQNHIRGLKSLAERLEVAIDRIANDDRVSPEQLEFVLWKLLLAADQLGRRLAKVRQQALAAPESNPQTSGPL
jgi:hypothetical protein